MVFDYSILLFVILHLVETQIYRGTTMKKSKYTITGFGNVITVNPNYNPDEGYQPYWPGGHWVFTTGHTPPSNKNFAYSLVVTKKLPDACGVPCNYLMASTGTVCARFINGSSLECNSYDSGRELCRKQNVMQNFENYCYFLSKRCTTTTAEKLIFEHLGPCYPLFDDIYRPVYKGDLISNRLSTYWKNLEESLNKAPPKPKWVDGKQVTVKKLTPPH